MGQNIDTDTDLYRLDLGDPSAIPEPLDDPDINRIRGDPLRTLRFVHDETAPVLTREGDPYLWTDRLDGPGERGVYFAPSDSQGGFLPGQPLPAPISSDQRDDGARVRGRAGNSAL